MISINLANVNNVFVLEDSIERIHAFREFLKDKEVVYTDNADIAIHELHKTKYDLIFLDHDLEGTSFFPDSLVEKTGFHVIDSLKDSINEDSQIVIHSVNPSGAANMLRAHPFNVIHIPFHMLLPAMKNVPPR